jgi:P-type Cu+ transporter
VVHDLLAENGLERFYELGNHPGVRVRGAAGREQWRYLDEPGLQQRLLDFTDGTLSRVTLHLPAIHCVACVWLLENLFRLHPGIGRSRVNFPRRELTVDFAADKIKLSELVGRLAAIGYEPVLTLGELDGSRPKPVHKRLWLQLGIAGFAFSNIMLFSLPLYFGLDRFSGPVFKTLFGWLSLGLALPVLVFSAADYWNSARLFLRQRRLTLDVPIALGLAALYAQSAFEILTDRGVGYLDSLAGLVFFLLCGRAFQHMTYERLAFERDYKSFFPLSVTRKTERRSPTRRDSDETVVEGAGSETGAPGEEQVPLFRLRVGDHLVIRHGELIPADGRLASEAALVDYSFVTGESEPVTRSEGDYLYAGGRQIGGAIELETVKPVSQSYLASLWNHEAFHKDREDVFASVTDRVGRYFTLAVIIVAAGAALGWLAADNPPCAIKAFTSVLIVACPCALALAAPFTFGTAQRRLARLGVFLKNAFVIERLARVDTIVLDKTGTLTEPGAGAVVFQGEPLRSVEAWWIHSLAGHSTHPHSARIKELLAVAADRTFNIQPPTSSIQFSEEPEASVQSFRETPGCGIEATIAGHEVMLGSQAWLESRGVTISGRSRREEALDSSGEQNHSEPPPVGSCDHQGSVVHVAIDGAHRGGFVLRSALRPEAAQLIRQLAGQYDVTLLSGDNERERERFQSLFGGSERLHFNQSPLDKLGYIRHLQESGRIVMMVGDGLNDAGALRQSDVGVAVVEQIGAFSPGCDVILDGRQVARLPGILAFARGAARIVRLGFGISVLYNLTGISIAAAGILSPLISAILMPLSSISVVLFACGMTNGAARRRLPKAESRIRAADLSRL